ncbi:MAG: hypothetical protein N2Z20_05240 [Elusimicrobiales bacterium]|nr:hypothetical protein [Elusimicrobiales bacterium]
MICFIFYLFSFLYSENNNINEVEKTEFISEYAFYDSSNSLVQISSNVIINLLDKNDDIMLNIKTDEAFINISSSIISFSSFTIETSSVYVNGITGYYNLDLSYGSFYNTYSRYDRFLVKSKLTNIYEKKHVYYHSYITTCEKNPPHYKISSSKIILSPGHYFLSYNNLFYLGKIPIMYFPVLYKPLGEGTPIISQFYPGYDERNGFYIKSNYTYKFSRFHKVRSYIDYYSKKGFGLGGELFGYKSDVFKYNFSYYRINEYGNSPVYWGFNGGLWRSFNIRENYSLYMQSFIRFPSDPRFNNFYFRSNPFVISTTRQWDISFTFKLPSSYLRLKSHTIYSSNNNIFLKYIEVMPQIEYQTITNKIPFLPLSHSLYVSVENSRFFGNTFQRFSKVNYNTYYSLNISKFMSFYNLAGITYNTSFSTSSKVSNSSVAKYNLNSSLRYSFKTGSFDIVYNGVFRSSVNKFSQDTKSLDRGIETNLLLTKLWFVNGISQYFSIQGGYDIKKYKIYSPELKRWLPFSFEYYKSFYNYELYFKEVYSFTSGHQAFITNMTSNFKKNYLTIGFANYESRKERFLISTILGYNPVPEKGWYGEFGLRCYVDFSKDMSLNFYEKSFIINKEFHDFKTRFVFRKIKDNNEFFFYITMKMNDPYRKDKIDSEIDKEFRPWRKFEEERDY